MNKNDYIIRLETKKDYYEVENLAREAFWNLSVPGCDEHYLIHVMRNHEDFISELAHIIEAGEKIIGCIMYTKSKLTDENGNIKPVVTMGPICIRPGFQRMGYGKALLEHTFEIVKKMGYDTVVNFGNPDNYVARGYKSCRKYNVCFEGDIFPAPLLVKVLRDNALDGRKWFYHPSNVDELCGDVGAVEEYDRLFSPKIKAWQPSQEEFYIHSHSIVVQ